MATCNELYRRTPAGLAPEIAFFTPRGDGDALPDRHAGDAGGGDFTVKPQARSPRAAAPAAARRPGAGRCSDGRPGTWPPVAGVLAIVDLQCALQSMPALQHTLSSAPSQQRPDTAAHTGARLRANAFEA